MTHSSTASRFKPIEHFRWSQCKIGVPSPNIITKTKQKVWNHGLVDVSFSGFRSLLPHLPPLENHCHFSPIFTIFTCKKWTLPVLILPHLPCISTSQANTTQEFFHTLGVQHFAAFDHFLPAKTGIRDPPVSQVVAKWAANGSLWLGKSRGCVFFSDPLKNDLYMRISWRQLGRFFCQIVVRNNDRQVVSPGIKTDPPKKTVPLKWKSKHEGVRDFSATQTPRTCATIAFTHRMLQKIPKPTFSTKLRTVACRKGNKAASSGTVTLTGTGAVEGTALSKPQRRDENLSEQ